MQLSLTSEQIEVTMIANCNVIRECNVNGGEATTIALLSEVHYAAAWFLFELTFGVTPT